MKSELKIFNADQSAIPIGYWTDHSDIAEQLGQKDVRFERWQVEQDVTAGNSQDAIIQAYRKHIDRLIKIEGYETVDVVSLASNHPDKAVMRKKFLDEHTHSEDEVRFFVAGQGLFSLHIENCVYEILCVKDDLIGIPANTRHWFDMGPNPEFVAIRLFNNPVGWVANFTGDDIAQRFNRLEN
jgi:1,2-dihydroxy-3-keto-5-methylthiopentene dioxygenase